jgi:hypothetical protein
MTRLADLRRFNKERGRQIRHYALNIYTCMSYVRRSFRKELAGDSLAQMNLDKSNSDTGRVRRFILQSYMQALIQNLLAP